MNFSYWDFDVVSFLLTSKHSTFSGISEAGVRVTFQSSDGSLTNTSMVFSSRSGSALKARSEWTMTFWIKPDSFKGCIRFTNCLVRRKGMSSGTGRNCEDTDIFIFSVNSHYTAGQKIERHFLTVGIYVKADLIVFWVKSGNLHALNLNRFLPPFYRCILHAI